MAVRLRTGHLESHPLWLIPLVELGLGKLHTREQAQHWAGTRRQPWMLKLHAENLDSEQG